MYELKCRNRFLDFINNNKKIVTCFFNIIYVLFFIIIVLIVGNYHEHWSDEAQSWLIARDSSFLDIIKYIRYEGTPPLWHFILKIFIICGLKYNNLIYITTLFTVVGVIFLFKNKRIPLIIKILLPYTYFIFFQFTIIARSYCLIFPILMYIAYIYPDKEKKLLKYAISLVLLMSISSHTFLIAGGLWLEYLIDELIKYKKTKKIDISKIVFFCVIFIAFLVIIIMVFPAKDNGYILERKFSFCRTISESMFTSTSNEIICAIGSILFFISLSMNFNNIKNLIRTIILILPNIIWICFINSAGWYIGILFLLVIFITTINNSFKNNKISYYLIIISIVIQIYWNVVCINNDIRNKFAIGEDVKNYLNEIGYQDKKICGIDFWIVQVNPFFEKNIFSNLNYSYINWKNEYYEDTKVSNINEEFDIYIIPINAFKYNSDITFNIDDEMYLLKKLKCSGLYDCKYFEGNMYYKDRIYETTGIYILSKNK